MLLPRTLKSSVIRFLLPVRISLFPIQSISSSSLSISSPSLSNSAITFLLSVVVCFYCPLPYRSIHLHFLYNPFQSEQLTEVRMRPIVQWLDGQVYNNLINMMASEVLAG